MSDLVLLKQNSPTCVSIVLNRVDQHNALSIELINELQRVLNKIGKEAKQSKIRAIKILSASTKAFCAGADLKERLNMNDKQIISVLNKLKKLTDTVENFPVPVFAIIEGVAFGGGLELALACDFRMASPAAKVGLTETRLGIIPGAGGTQRLSRLIGESAAKEFIFRAKRIESNEAFSKGLFQFLGENPESEADVWIADILEAAPLSIIESKKAIQGGRALKMSQALSFERRCYTKLLKTKDRVEALQAFIEKRKAKFCGR